MCNQYHIFRRFVFLCYLLFLLAFGLSSNVVGQGLTQAAFAATLAADLTFPREPTNSAAVSPSQMALLVPDGAGPFPAIVLVHPCSGLNAMIANYAREAMTRGFVVLMIDSLGPRAVTSVCYGPRNGVNFFRGLRDALQAADHLRSLPAVDKTRVGLVGYSWGGMIGLMSSSPQYREWLGFGSPFAKIVAHYPGCFTINPPGGKSYEIFNVDSDVRLLALIGSDDTETPAAECVGKFRQAADRGAPVTWHMYPNATHCWDCKQIDGLRKIDVRGNEVVYRFNGAVAKDATDRTFTFLNGR